MIAAILIFAMTYLVMAVGKLPGWRLDRAGAALLGGSLMVGCGVLTLDEAYRAIDMETITLLLGMMIVVANLRLSGFFRLVNGFVVPRAHYPIVLLTAIVLTTGILSAFLVNDTICLVMTPLVIDVVERLEHPPIRLEQPDRKAAAPANESRAFAERTNVPGGSANARGRNPVPYLLAVALASNAGSVATITGNPQNMIIGSLAHIPYGTFVGTLAPVAVVGLLLTILLIALIYRSEFLTKQKLAAVPPQPTRYHSALVWRTVLTVLAMIVLFFAGLPIAQVAILAGALLLVTRRVKPEKVYFDIDWPLLVMFTGLFIVVAGLEKTVLTPDAVAEVGKLNLASLPILATVTAVLSNIVSNVPAVLVLKPFVAGLADPERAWLAIAMASTLAGNFTLIGSVANLIVAQRARQRGITLGFWPYFTVGAPLTVLSIAFGVVWMGWMGM